MWKLAHLGKSGYFLPVSSNECFVLSWVRQWKNAIRDGLSGRSVTADVRGLVASTHKRTDDARQAAQPMSTAPECSAGQGLWLLIDIEERARAGRRVGGAGESSAPEDQDNDDDEQERERAAEAGGKRHGQRVTYEARRDG